MTWSRVDDEALAGPGEQQMTTVACNGAGVVAGGTEIIDGERDAAVWLSADGTGWRRVDDPDLRGPGAQWIWDMALTDQGLVAAGSTGSTSDSDATIWVSSDGSDWARDDSVPGFTGRGDQFAGAVAPLGNGVVVAGGNDRNAAVWVSRDVEHWDQMLDPSLGGDGKQAIFGLTVDGPSIFALGESDNDAAVWVYDGSTWSRSGDEESLGGYGGQGMEAMVATEDGYVGVGNEYTYDEIFLRGGSRGTFDGAVWLSDDADDWVRLERAEAFEGVGEQTVSGVIQWDGGFLAFGYDLAGRGTVEEGGLPFGSGEDVDAAVWVSPDGLIWTKVASPEFGGDDWQDILDVVDCPNIGLVAVGGDDLGTPPA